ncbi:hypothetical protein C5D34_12120 [Rathayibacter sp. AY1B1]|uniref:hypothetical protein n=1 Tax=Rathayibacter sp. AY1B6 TaxID=2080531 RepID=UPI000CE81474|nr:hypothetical protein [Rathayibacter sp. AY1B6]PPI19056.1 hypothetical protein C5D08_15035 [Rathayibacter sp. AY1B6]PPI31340.1 hypothetical protein C5D34_12120 [Rathayibacter sp. AY1B1]
MIAAVIALVEAAGAIVLGAMFTQESTQAVILYGVGASAAGIGAEFFSLAFTPRNRLETVGAVLGIGVLVLGVAVATGGAVEKYAPDWAPTVALVAAGAGCVAALVGAFKKIRG